VSKILGIGHCLPGQPVTDAEIALLLGGAVDFEAKIDASGARSRHFADEGQGPSDLAKIAAESALREAGLAATDIEFLIFATMTPDVTFPGSGCYLQDKLGCGTIGALDVRAQCAGFVFALEIAEQFLRSGVYGRILVAAGDVHSSGLDFSERGAAVTPLFGDGAAAVVLGGGGEGLIESAIHTDATDFERFWCELPSSRRRRGRFVPQDLPLGKHYPSLDAEFIKRDGADRIRAGVQEVLSKSGAQAQQVRRYFFQHVYRESAQAAAHALGVADRTTVGGLDEGHVASASLPIALSRARAAEEVGNGDLVCLATAGAGMNWAAALVRL
jgi:3-oxoacyl-[acyl-carrier-protein] synthase III